MLFGGDGGISRSKREIPPKNWGPKYAKFGFVHVLGQKQGYTGLNDPPKNDQNHPKEVQNPLLGRIRLILSFVVFSREARRFLISDFDFWEKYFSKNFYWAIHIFRFIYTIGGLHILYLPILCREPATPPIPHNRERIKSLTEFNLYVLILTETSS